MQRHHLLRIFLIASTIFLVAIILTDITHILRGPAPETSEWYWPYLLRPIERWWAPSLAAMSMLIISVWWFNQPDNRPRVSALGLVGLLTTNLLLQMTLVYADHPNIRGELINRTLSNLSGGFFQPAAEIADLAGTLRNYPERMLDFSSEHAQTHPPGLIMGNWLTIQGLGHLPSFSEGIARQVYPARCTDLWLFDRSVNVAAALALWSLLPSIAGALTIVPAYFLARRWFSNKASILATALVASLPALLIFSPKTVQFYALLGISALLLLDLGLDRRAWIWFFISGFILSIGSFLNFGNVALLVIMFLYVGLFIWQRKPIGGQTNNLQIDLNRRQALADTLIYLAAFIAGIASIWFLYWLAWGVAPWSIALAGLRQHFNLVTFYRKYEWWLAYNLVDLIIYAGLPLIIGFILALFAAIRDLTQQKLDAAGRLVIAVALLIILLNISGSTRGEVGRIWLFLMPFMALVSAPALVRSFPGRLTGLMIIALQLAIVVSLGLAWRPVRAVIVVAEEPEMALDVVPEIALHHTFNEPDTNKNRIGLIGYSVDTAKIESQNELGLTLFWESLGPVTRPYTVFTHLLDENGELIAQKDNWPLQGRWPATCWSTGDKIVDEYKLELPRGLPPGQYTLTAGLYDTADGHRLQTEKGEDQIILSQLTINPDS